MTEPITRVTRSVISDPDAQAAIWFLGALSQLRISGAQTGGACALADHLAARGNASPETRRKALVWRVRVLLLGIIITLVVLNAAGVLKLY